MIVLTTYIKSYSQELPAFRSLRFDEDYSFLENDTSANWYRKMKFSPLSKSRKTYISYGGDVRIQWPLHYTVNSALICALSHSSSDIFLGEINGKRHRLPGSRRKSLLAQIPPTLQAKPSTFMQRLVQSVASHA